MALQKNELKLNGLLSIRKVSEIEGAAHESTGPRKSQIQLRTVWSGKMFARRAAVRFSCTKEPAAIVHA